MSSRCVRRTSPPSHWWSVTPLPSRLSPLEPPGHSSSLETESAALAFRVM
ncbi:MAG: hypothetical protein ACYTAQ_14765 [Planctomycetota bacterium]